MASQNWGQGDHFHGHIDAHDDLGKEHGFAKSTCGGVYTTAEVENPRFICFNDLSKSEWQPGYVIDGFRKDCEEGCSGKTNENNTNLSWLTCLRILMPLYAATSRFFCSPGCSDCIYGFHDTSISEDVNAVVEEPIFFCLYVVDSPLLENVCVRNFFWHFARQQISTVMEEEGEHFRHKYHRRKASWGCVAALVPIGSINSTGRTRHQTVTAIISRLNTDQRQGRMHPL